MVVVLGTGQEGGLKLAIAEGLRGGSVSIVYKCWQGTGRGRGGGTGGGRRGDISLAPI